MDIEDLEISLSKGTCRKCQCIVVFAHSLRLGDISTRLETRKCLNCGQVYSKDDRWKEVIPGKEA